jgi:hypothetical protein
MADDLRASISNAIEEDIKDEVAPTTETPVDAPASDAPADTNSNDTDTGSSVPAEPASDVPAELAPTVDLPPPPASWKGDAKQVWNDLPETARNEVIRRESHVNRVLAENADARSYAGAIHQVVERHANRIAEFGIPPAQVFDTLLEADRMLSTAEPVQKAQYMAKLIKDYNIDISALDNALSGATPAIPDVSRQVQMQVDAALAPFRQQQQAAQEADYQAVVETIESMVDNPDYPQFEAVRDDMADIIEIKAKRGIYISLPEAYNIVTGQPQQRVAAVKQNNATAQKAKSAAVSVSGTPTSSAGGADPTDLRGTISSILDGIR